MRLTAAAQRKVPTRSSARPASVPASTGGWNTIDALANMPPTDAVQMDNIIPRAGWLEPRRGFEQWATGMGSTTPVESLMSYYNTSSNQMFAAAGTTIYDVTGGGAAIPTTVTTLSSARCQHENFTNSAGTHYLVVCNGANDALIFDNTTWASMAVTVVNPATFIQPHAFKGRLWFVIDGSTDVAYLPIGAIAGAAARFPLGSFMGQGGYINAIASWTVDTRQTVNDYIAFITSRGQVIVYTGTDPTDATNFLLVGIYNLGPPIGRRCFLKIAGDLAIITLDGVVSMNQMLSTDRSASNRTSLSAKISPTVNAAIAAYGQNFGWQLTAYPRGTLAILNVPVVENGTALQYVMNTITGAWCQFLGINASAWGILGEDIYFGGDDGIVYQWDTTAGDDGSPITGTTATAFNYFGTRGRLKHFGMVRPILTTDGSVIPGIGLNVDFGQGAPISSPTTVATPTAEWDAAVWDTAEWPPNSSTSAYWQAIVGEGQCASIVTQIVTSANGAANGVTLNINGWDVTFAVGGFV